MTNPLSSVLSFAFSWRTQARLLAFASLAATCSCFDPTGIALSQDQTVVRDLSDAEIQQMKLLEPVWSGPIVHHESVLLFQETEGGPLSGRLAFPASEILSVRRANQEPSADLNKSLQWNDKMDRFEIPTGIIGPYVQRSEIYKAIDAPMSYKHKVNEPNVGLLYAPGRWFHDRQIEVTYRRVPMKWTGKVPKFASEQLPRTTERLAKGQPLHLGISGDSISTGLDASLTAQSKPFQPGYPELVRRQLAIHYHCPVTIKNRSVAGWSIANGLNDLDVLLAEKPNLIIMAYGMNDVGRRDPKWFHEQASTFIDRVHAHDPSIEIILVATMLGNKEWIHTPRAMFYEYEAQLESLVRPGVALADLTAIWTELLKNKDELDLTGNGLNHPNDYGHRLYAQAVLGLLIENGMR